jgi:hypothetical protein
MYTHKKVSLCIGEYLKPEANTETLLQKQTQYFPLVVQLRTNAAIVFFTPLRTPTTQWKSDSTAINSTGLKPN